MTVSAKLVDMAPDSGKNTRATHKHRGKKRHTKRSKRK